MCVKGFSYTVICLLFISGYSAAQQTSSSGALQSGETKKTIINYKPGHSYFTVGTGDSLRVIDEDMTEMIDVIVEFKQDPLFIQQSKNKLSKASPLLYKTQQTQFSSDLSALYKNAAKSYSVNLAMPQKKDEYHKVFNGASLFIPRAMIAPVASLPYVKKVHINKKVHVELDVSVNLIGAETVWSAYNARGEGIVIGIIDTGIDYLHPALGEGIGPGHKVIGGYDFVNKDNDPMDDNGHGTHVAGITAADNSVIKGVAPGASLFALKVMDSYGSGLESDIVSAIEMTVDPDNNESTDDKLDVVNMSLGSEEGNPFDAMTEAVNNAVKLGVTYCISAGNSGDYNTICSPGTAELAITVGASDKLDNIAPFSSRGPVNKTYSMKPDILAPGVNIRSGYMGGRYESLSGTSMAAPHVAGSCALLKQLHPDWSPEMIKSALMTTAKNLGLDFMTQGTGRINVFDASKVRTLAVPSQLSFGLDTLDSGILKTMDTIEVINKSLSAQTYNITVSGLFPGVELEPDVNSFSVQPGASQKVIFTLSAGKSVPYLTDKKYSYEGRIAINGNTDSL
ncbi:MAG: S8 family serine peptidase, partial [Syntrophothermus sp.]